MTDIDEKRGVFVKTSGEMGPGPWMPGQPMTAGWLAAGELDGVKYLSFQVRGQQDVAYIEAPNLYSVKKRASGLNTVVDVAILQDPDYDPQSEYFPNLDWMAVVGTRGRMKKMFAYLGHPL